MKKIEIDKKGLDALHAQGFTHFVFLSKIAPDGIEFAHIPGHCTASFGLWADLKEIDLDGDKGRNVKGILWDADELPARNSRFIPSFFKKGCIFTRAGKIATSQDLRPESEPEVPWTDEEEGWE